VLVNGQRRPQRPASAHVRLSNGAETKANEQGKRNGLPPPPFFGPYFDTGGTDRQQCRSLPSKAPGQFPVSLAPSKRHWRSGDLQRLGRIGCRCGWKLPLWDKFGNMACMEPQTEVHGKWETVLISRPVPNPCQACILQFDPDRDQ
jgi:hypothetical protein